MQNFTYHTPTKIVFGKESERQVGSLIRGQGCKRALVHFGGRSAQASGLLDRVYESLEEAGVSYVPLGGVVPNPRMGLAYEGIELCRREKVEFILAVGGGSVIDSAKTIAYGLANEFDVWELFDHKASAQAFFPLGSILTIAATGSETSNSTVMTKEDGLLKRGYNDDISRPLFAIMNPELTYTLPQYQTMSGCVDILMHTLERYFTSEQAPMEITLSMSEALLRTVMAQALVLMKEPKSYQARAEIMWAGSLSHIGLMQCGGTRGDWACHRLEHELGGLFDVAHGAGLSALWGSWARYVYASNPGRFSRLALQVLQVPEQGSAEQNALKGIEAMEAFFRSIQMPVSIRELGVEVTEEEIALMAKKCAAINPVLGDFRPLREADMQAIYRMAR